MPLILKLKGMMKYKNKIKIKKGIGKNKRTGRKR